jgi:hypothetical protein
MRQGVGILDSAFATAQTHVLCIHPASHLESPVPNPESPIALPEIRPAEHAQPPAEEFVMRILSSHESPQPDPRLDRMMRRIVLVGALLVLALPVARGHSAWLGALPLWLLGMPLVGWWALHRFALPRVPTLGLRSARSPRRTGPQARRRPTLRARARIAHAA